MICERLSRSEKDLGEMPCLENSMMGKWLGRKYSSGETEWEVFGSINGGLVKLADGNMAQ